MAVHCVFRGGTCVRVYRRQLAGDLDHQMPESLLIGTHGWDYPDWNETFYPTELPPEWRFCYFSNRLRSVLVPTATWDGLEPGRVRSWLQDCDGQFRFLLELPAALSRPSAPTQWARDWEAFRVLIEPLHAQIAGLVLRIATDMPPDRDWLAQVLQALAADKPLCVELPSPAWCSSELQALVRDTGAGRFWNADAEAAPVPGGTLLVGRTRGGHPKALRQMIESLAAAQHRDTLAGLFIAPPGSVAMAEEARIIAEILGK
jgi:hypothetical protein